MKFASSRYTTSNNKPTLLTTHPEIEPNDTGVSTILAIGAMMTRVKFWTALDPMGNLLKQIVGAYIVDDQRSSLCSLLREEMSKLPLISSTRKRSGWFPGDPATIVTPASKTKPGPAFHAL